MSIADVWNDRRVPLPTAHARVPMGVNGCATCVFGKDHPVHASSQENVVLLRPRKGPRTMRR